MTRKRSDLVFALTVAALTVCAFLPVLSNGFVWDDELNLLANPSYRGLGWANIRWMFTTAYLGPYQPLTWLSFSLDHALWGMRPFGYHLTNLLLHAANTALVYLLALRLLPLAVPRNEREDSMKLSLCAAAAALLFALHPLRVESVAWATERRGVLAGFFYLATLLCYLPSARDRTSAGTRRRRLGLAAMLFLLSLLSKGIGIALPVTLLALDVYPLRRLPADLRRWATRQALPILLEKSPFFLLALAFGVVELIAYSHHLTPTPADALGLRAAKACFALVFYLVKTLAPFDLSPSYGTVWPFTACAAALLTVTAALYRMRDRWPFGLPAWVHYIATLAPVLGFIRFGNHVVADRYTYLACAGWPILAAGGLRSLGRVGGRAARGNLRFALGATAAVIVGLSFLTWEQTRVWRDSIRLWSHAWTLEPDSAFVRKILGNSYYNLGNAYLHRGRPQQARQLYLEALSVDPGNAATHSNLGTVLLEYGAWDEAASQFQRTIELTPDNAFAYNGLGLALIRKGRFEQGAANFCRALSIDPSLAGVEANLRAVLARFPGSKKGLDDDCSRRLTKPG